MSALYKRGTAQISGNLTPMIDMTFLLIVFFVLVSRIVSSENVDLRLPEPINPETITLAEENRIVINIKPAESGGAILGYRMGGRDFPPDAAGLQSMTEQLTELYRSNPAINVNLRADRRTHYELVEPVMQMISDAARQAHASIEGAPAGTAARVNLVVATEN